jgi:hypothetical protein
MITAAPFYTRFGFKPYPRGEVPQAVGASVEFASACPASSSCLVCVLRQGRPSSGQEDRDERHEG